MGRYSSALTGPRPSIGSPSRLKTRPSVSLPTGTEHGLAGIDDVHAAHQAVGRAQGDAANAVAAEVLLHLAGQVDGHALVVGVDAEGVVDLRQMAFFKLGVEGRADDLHDAAGVLAGAELVGSGNHASYSRVDLLPARSASKCEGSTCWRLRARSIVIYSNAAAPPMTSAISLVICACRARLYWRVRS